MKTKKITFAVGKGAVSTEGAKNPDSELCSCCCGYGYVGDYADESGDICECCGGDGTEIKESQ